LINFRYHIVSLMAVFLALAVGIAVGVTLRPSVDEGLAAQAAQDRKQVQDLRAELLRRSALDEYRDVWASRVGEVVTAGLLAGSRVAVVSMPDAPTAVVQSISTAVTTAGGTVSRTVKISKDVFDPDQAEKLNTAVSPYAGSIGLTDSMAEPTKFGLALGRAIAAKVPGVRDEQGTAIGKALSSAGLISVSGDSTATAQLIIVVGAVATDPRTPAELLSAHVQMDVALRGAAVGLVLAGPNSDEIEGTDVLSVRSDATAVDVVSTVDVADLESGVITTVLAGKEQLLGGGGRHYGALSKADAPLPTLPIR
jgi:Copper transport outer membrane protein, MctB